MAPLNSVRPSDSPRSALALRSVILGVIGLGGMAASLEGSIAVFLLVSVASVGAVVSGHTARALLGQPDSTQRGASLAMAGFVFGYVGVGMLSLFIIGFVSVELL